ncbi:hypothetical protein [Pectobacterium sp. F1-1]|uniref:hypothetical protein n=1 Tax=Pectobacterium sp. F1-1 TaxID=2949614 RepID=UPI0021D7A06A|nr:hypothetical protein [Pectobacterium sp. F1-1]
MTTITKTKRFFMGAFMGALLDRLSNKNNNKQHVNRKYDPESGTTNLKNPPKRRVFAFGASMTSAIQSPSVYTSPAAGICSSPANANHISQ